MVEYTIGVNGMMCGNCEKHVVEAVQKVAGVKSVVADKDAKRAVVTAKESADVGRIKAAIVEAGYEVTGCEQKALEKKGFFARFKK